MLITSLLTLIKQSNMLHTQTLISCLCAVAITILATNLVNCDNSLCVELQAYKDELNVLDKTVKRQFAADKACPEEYALRLDADTYSSIENYDITRDAITEISNLIKIERERPQGCMSKLIPRRCTKLEKLEIALTYALYHECLVMLRQLQDVEGLVLVKRLKLMRRQMKGIPITDLIFIEQLFLHRLIDSCQNNPYSVLSVRPRETRESIGSMYERLVHMTNPEDVRTRWGPERETVEIVHKIVKQAYEKIQTNWST